MHYVYMLKSKSTNKNYIGFTQDLKSRLIQHQSGRSDATKGVKDWELIYSEEYLDRSLAMKREKYFKTGDGRKVLKNKGLIS